MAIMAGVKAVLDTFRQLPGSLPPPHPQKRPAVEEEESLFIG